jgi:GT2 family glycosyltransferase
MTVAVLVVNWNSGDLLRRCLHCLNEQQRRPDQVIVVDNASTDDSLSLAADVMDDVKLIRLPQNVGFARANNLGAAAASGVDALALLNPDAFPDPRWLESLVAAADRHPDVAAFASQIRLASAPDRLDGAGDTYHVSGRAWRSAHKQPLTAAPDAEVEVFAPCAAAALYRRRAFEEVGGFDERYFCYFEDLDLGFRLRLRGHRSLYVPAAIVEHVSSALSGYRSDFSVYHGERNMVWTFVKNMPTPLFWRYLPQHLLLNVASLFYYPLRGQGRVVWRAKLDALKGLPLVWRDRRTVQNARRVEPDTLRRALRHGVTIPYLKRYSRQ